MAKPARLLVGSLAVVGAAAIALAQLTLVATGGDKETFELTEHTTFKRGDTAASLEDVAPGERAVVMYEKKGEKNLAIEVKLGPKAE